MSLFSAIRVALAALQAKAGQSALTCLGIVIGISAVIALLAAGDGARETLDERMDSVGKNLILIRPGKKAQSGEITDQTPLTREDADAVRKQVGGLLVGVAEVQVALRVATSRHANWPTQITGTTPDMQQVRNWRILSGRYFTEEEVKRQAPVCLIGQTVRRKLFPDNPNPVGETIRLDRLQLQVIGVLGDKGHNPAGGDQDNEIFVPITTLQRKLAGEERIAIILTAVRSQGMTEQAMEEITRVLRDRHRVKPGSEDFDVSSVREMAEVGYFVMDTLKLLVAIIASISLVVGGIGIMNIMLVSVTERTREIGLRMAVGATPVHVLTQFLLEAVVLALIGGVLGVTLGLATSVGLALLIGWPLIVSPFNILVAFLVTAAVGVFFGFYPALKAARLDPIEALRYE